MKFRDAISIANIIWEMKEADWPRAENRVRIDRLFNGFAPYTPQEAEDQGIQTNISTLESTKLATDARRQFENAFLKPGNYFAVMLRKGPTHKRMVWSHTITRRLNRVLKDSLAYTECLREVFAQLVLHGVGPVMWEDRYRWRPGFIGIEDLLVPSNTKLTLENLDYFAIFRRRTPGEMMKMITGKTVDKGWNVSYVMTLIKQKIDAGPMQANWPNWEWPEKWAEDFKENSGFWVSDAIPTIDCWDFYYRDSDEDGAWKKSVILDFVTQPNSAPNADGAHPFDSSKAPKELLYHSPNVYSEKLSQLLHVQFADGANVAPFRYHSIRSLGFLLYGLGHLQNRLHCRFTDAVFESMNWYFRNVRAEDREKLEMVQLKNMGVIPDGLNFVLPQERHTINEELLSGAFARNRQLMSDNSASYVQDAKSISEKKETATAVMARVNSAATLVNGMLARAYNYQDHQYAEICRRFCLVNSLDPDVRKFQSGCVGDGIPLELLNIDYWDIESEKVMGAGNKALEVAQATQLLEVYPKLEPDPQRQALHMYVEAITDDPSLAEVMVPIEDTKPVSNSIHDANLAMGTLLQGIPVAVKQGMNHVEQIETLLTLTQFEVQKIEQAGGMTTPEKVNGLLTVCQHIEAQIGIVQQDEGEKDKVKQYNDALTNLMNYIKGYAQRIAEQQKSANQQGGGLAPEVQAKLMGSVILAQSQAKIKEQKAKQQQQHKQVAFVTDQIRKQSEHKLEMARKRAELSVDLAKDAAQVRKGVFQP